MKDFFKKLIDNATGLRVYSICFIIIFNIFFVPGIGRGAGFVLVVMSFSLQAIILVFFPLMIWLLDYLGNKKSRVLCSITLFIVAEIAFFIVRSELSLFGLFTKPIVGFEMDDQNTMIGFRKNLSFALSMSSLISVVCYFFGLIIQEKFLTANKTTKRKGL